MAPPTDSHQLHQPLVSSTSHFINKAIITMGLCLSGWWGGAVGHWTCMCMWRSVGKIISATFKDFLLSGSNMCVCVWSCHSLTYRMCHPIPFTTWKDLLAETEFVLVLWWDPFQEVTKASRHYNIASNSAAICRLSLVASTVSWLNAGQLWFIHSFCHVKMIHGSTLSKPMQRAWSLAHSL